MHERFFVVLPKKHGQFLMDSPKWFIRFCMVPPQISTVGEFWYKSIWKFTVMKNISVLVLCVLLHDNVDMTRAHARTVLDRQSKLLHIQTPRQLLQHPENFHSNIIFPVVFLRLLSRQVVSPTWGPQGQDNTPPLSGINSYRDNPKSA